jgi:hypothetical protein
MTLTLEETVKRHCKVNGTDCTAFRDKWCMGRHCEEWSRKVIKRE